MMYSGQARRRTPALPDDRRSDIESALVHYIDDYNWDWGVAGKLIKRRFGVVLSHEDIRTIYKNVKADE